MKFLIVIFTFLASFSCLAQVGGERIFNFLNVTTSARQAALGGEAITLFDDIYQPVWNPSVINSEINGQVGLSYVSFLSEVNYGSISYAHLFTRRLGTFHGNITYVNYGKFIAADEQGNEQGTFKAQDITAQVGYAYDLPLQGFKVGANFKFISSTIENFTSTGLAADIAVSYRNEQKPYAFTAMIRNIGYQISAYDDEKENFPLNVAVGASYKLENVPLQWHVTIDNLQQWKLAVSNPSKSKTDFDGEITDENITFLNNFFRHVSIGAELFPDKGFNLRLGYNFRRGAELSLNETRTFAGFTAGFGLKMRRLKLNYAFTKFHPVSNTNTFSLTIDLAQKGSKKY